MYRRKRLNKPWIEESVVSNNKGLRSKIVRVLCRSSNIGYGAVVKVVTDGELKIVAAFTEEAVKAALNDLDSDGNPCWNTALLILHEYSIELRNIPGKDYGEFVLFVERFNIWDLQPGYQAKYDFKFCMENEQIWNHMMAVYAERKASKFHPAADTSTTGSVSLTQLLDEMAAPSSELQTSHDHTEQNLNAISDSLRMKLLAPFTVEEFLISEQDADSLDQIHEWKSDYVPQSSSDDKVSSDMIHDMSCPTQPGLHQEDKHNPVTQPSNNPVNNRTTYLGIAVTPSQSSEDEDQRRDDNHKEAGPVNTLQNKLCDSLSQDASQWQEGLDSVRFSFETEDSLSSSGSVSPVISTSQIGVPAAHSTQRECTQNTPKQLEQPSCAQVLVLSKGSSIDNTGSSESMNADKYTEMEDDTNKVLSSQGNISQSSLSGSDKQVMMDYYKVDTPCQTFNTSEMRLRNRDYSLLKKREKIREKLKKIRDKVEMISPTRNVNLNVTIDNEMDNTANQLCDSGVGDRHRSPRCKKVVGPVEDTDVSESAEDTVQTANADANADISNADVSNVVNEDVSGKICTVVKDKVNINEDGTSLQESKTVPSGKSRNIFLTVKTALSKRTNVRKVAEQAKETNNNENSSIITAQNTDLPKAKHSCNDKENVSLGPVAETVVTHEQIGKNSNESSEIYPSSTFSPRETPSDYSTGGICTMEPSQDSAPVIENSEEVGKSSERVKMELRSAAGTSKNFKELSPLRRSRRLKNVGNSSPIKMGNSSPIKLGNSSAINMGNRSSSKHTEINEKKDSCLERAEVDVKRSTEKISRDSVKIIRTTAEIVDQILKSRIRQPIQQCRKSKRITPNKTDGQVIVDPVVGDTKTCQVAANVLESGQSDLDEGELQVSVEEAKKDDKRQTEAETIEPKADSAHTKVAKRQMEAETIEPVADSAPTKVAKRQMEAETIEPVADSAPTKVAKRQMERQTIERVADSAPTKVAKRQMEAETIEPVADSAPTKVAKRQMEAETIEHVADSAPTKVAKKQMERQTIERVADSAPTKGAKRQMEAETIEHVADSAPTIAECDEKSTCVKHHDHKSRNRNNSPGKILDFNNLSDKQSENKDETTEDNVPGKHLNKKPYKETVLEEGISGTQPFDVVHFPETLGFTPNLSANSMVVSDSSFNELFEIDKGNDIHVKTSDHELSTDDKLDTIGSKTLNKSTMQATKDSFTRILEKPIVAPENPDNVENKDDGKMNLSESLSSSESLVFMEPLHKHSNKTDRKLNSDLKLNDSKDKPVECTKERRSLSLKSMFGNKVPSVKSVQQKRKRTLSVEKADKLKKVKYAVAEVVDALSVEKADKLKKVKYAVAEVVDTPSVEKADKMKKVKYAVAEVVDTLSVEKADNLKKVKYAVAEVVDTLSVEKAVKHKKVKYSVAEVVEDCTKPDSGSDCILVDDRDVNVDAENDNLSVKDKTSLKTYEPKKVYINGNCFGNKNMWPNYIGNKVSGEVKQKQSRDRSNRKRLSCQSSQSSESNEQHRNESKNQVDTLTEKSKSLRNADERGQLKYGQVDGKFRFYRVDDNVTPTKNRDSETLDKKTPERGDKTGCSKCKMNSPIVLCKKLTPRKLCAGTSELDKRSFVNDWLMKHKKISEPRKPEGSQEWALNEHTSADMPVSANQKSDVLGDQPDKSAGKQPSFTAGNQPDKSAGKQPSFTAGNQPDTSAGKQPSFTAGNQPDKSAGKQPSFTAGNQPDKSAGKQPSFTAGNQPDKSAGKQPSFTAGNQPDKSAGNQLNKSEEDLFDFSDSSDKSPNHDLNQNKSNHKLKMGASYRPTRGREDIEYHGQLDQVDPKSPQIPQQQKPLSAADLYFKMFEMM